jgi:sugar phosphate isomerase/epimerase
MLRRTLLAASLAAALAQARTRIDLSRISLLTDEVADTPQQAIAFAKQYGIGWLELRGMPDGRAGGGRREYYVQDEATLLQAAKEFKQAKLKISFLNTGMLKFTLPGAEPARARQETPEARTKRLAREQQQFDQRLDSLNKAIRCAEIFGVAKIRVFTFTRVADPAALFPKLVPILDEMGSIARRAGMKLLIENEGSCNVGTSGEMADLLRLVPNPAIGINWDPVNGMSREKPFPEGYKLLPFARLGNVQMKARALVIGPDFLDWAGIYDALARDGYKGQIGLETHVFDGTLIEKAHLCLKEIGRLTSRPS